MNLVDKILEKYISKVFTKDEWHTAVIGFSDGLSFEMKGRWMRRRLGNPEKDVEGIDVEKVWYYRVPYVLGEFTKLGFVVVVFGQGCGVLLV